MTDTFLTDTFLTDSQAAPPASVGGIAVQVFQPLLSGSSRFAPPAAAGVGTRSQLRTRPNGQLDERTCRAISQVSVNYLRRYLAHHGRLRVPGVAQPVPLETLYVPARVRSQHSLRSLVTQAFANPNSHDLQHQRHSQLPALLVARSQQYLGVLGEPGSGRTTLLRWLGMQALQAGGSQYGHACIPVYLDLKRLAGSTATLTQLLAAEFQAAGFPWAQRFTAEALAQGKLLLLLDGLDEISEAQREPVILRLEDLVERWPKNRFVITSSPAAQHHFRRFVSVHLHPWGEDQTGQLIDRWFRRKPELSRQCWEALQLPAQHEARQLAQSPWLLTLLCQTYRYHRSLPGQTASLYQASLRLGLSQLPGLSPQGLKLAAQGLARLAVVGMRRQYPFVSKPDLLACLRACQSQRAEPVDLPAIVEALTTHSGLLAATPDGYSFVHPALQEYLCACYVVAHRHQGSVAALARQHLETPSWQGVLRLLAAALPEGGDALLLSLQSEAAARLHSTRASALLHWAERVTARLDAPEAAATRRACALHLALNFALERCSQDALAACLDRVLLQVRTLARGQARSLNLSRDLELSLATAREFASGKVFALDAPAFLADLAALGKAPSFRDGYARRTAFVEALVGRLLHHLQLNEALFQLDEVDVLALERFFQANLLIQSCWEAALRVSPEAQQQLQAQMLCAPNASARSLKP